jgi:hypothetical protein
MEVCNLFLNKTEYYIENNLGCNDICNKNNLNDEKIIWRIVENEYVNDCISEVNLTLHDIFKLGKYKLFISEIHKINHNKEIKKLFSNIHTKKVYCNEKLNEEIICRFCHSHGNEYKNDFLISLCNCIGSIQYVHLQCLKKWVYTKLKIYKRTKVWKMKFHKFYCELCKVPFPCIFLF